MIIRIIRSFEDYEKEIGLKPLVIILMMMVNVQEDQNWYLDFIIMLFPCSKSIRTSVPKSI